MWIHPSYDYLHSATRQGHIEHTSALEQMEIFEKNLFPC